MQRLVAEGDPARAGEGESFVSLHTSIPIIIYTYHFSNTYGSSTTHQSSHIRVSLNPMTTFLPSGIPIHDSLAFSSRLAKHYSELQGQDSTMTNIAAAEVVRHHEYSRHIDLDVVKRTGWPYYRSKSAFALLLLLLYATMTDLLMRQLAFGHCCLHIGLHIGREAVERETSLLPRRYRPSGRAYQRK